MENAKYLFWASSWKSLGTLGVMLVLFFAEILIEEFCVYQVSNLSQHVAELEGQIDRAHRDKNSLSSQLEDTLHKLTSQEQDNTKVYFTHCACIISADITCGFEVKN